jgi:RNA polymerase sigma-70 factor (ECF subfamily)
VLRLAYFGGFTHHEIAQMLELPLGTVKSRLRLALERLRQSLVGVEGAVT